MKMTPKIVYYCTLSSSGSSCIKELLMTSLDKQHYDQACKGINAAKRKVLDGKPVTKRHFIVSRFRLLNMLHFLMFLQLNTWL